MPNWKKVIVSGSDADLNKVKAGSYFIPPTGSGSVPAKAYSIAFFDTSSGDNYDQIYKDNQNKLFWYPAGGLNVIGNITAGGAGSFVTASNIVASTSLTGSNLHVNGLPAGTTETRVLVSDTGGNIKYRTNLSLQGTTGTQGITGPTGNVGPTGPLGPQGTVGTKGATGNQGDIGPQGTTGNTGEKGATGAYRTNRNSRNRG